MGDVFKAHSMLAKWKALGLRVTELHDFHLRKVYVKSNDLQAAEEQLRKLPTAVARWKAGI